MEDHLIETIQAEDLPKIGESEEGPSFVDQQQEEAQQQTQHQRQVSKDSIDTNELTDLYHSSADEQDNALNQQDGPNKQPSQHKRQALKTEIKELKQVVEDQKQQLDKVNQNNVKLKSKIAELLEVIKKQNEEIASLKENQRIRGPVSKSQHHEKLNKPDRSDFWKENDEDFYKMKKDQKFQPGTDRHEMQNQKRQQQKTDSQSPETRILQGVSNTDKSKKKLKMDENKQDLFISKESESMKKDLKKFKSEVSKQQDNAQAKQDPNSALLLSKQKKAAIVYPVMEKLKAAKNGAGGKKNINEDIPLYDSDKKTGVNVITVTPPPPHEQEEENIQSNKQEAQINDPLIKKESSVALKPLKQIKEKHNYNKLEALKFKMSLQLRNLRLLRDHDLLMRGIEKKQVGGQKRENKLQNIQQINRLERDIDRTSKQLRIEMNAIHEKYAQGLGPEDPAKQEADEAFLNECEEMFTEAEDYFAQKEYERMEKLIRKDYRQVHSKINTNLNGPKPRYMRALPQDQEDYKEVEDNYGIANNQNADIQVVGSHQYLQQDDQVDDTKAAEPKPAVVPVAPSHKSHKSIPKAQTHNRKSEAPSSINISLEEDMKGGSSQLKSQNQLYNNEAEEQSDMPEEQEAEEERFSKFQGNAKDIDEYESDARDKMGSRKSLSMNSRRNKVGSRDKDFKLPEINKRKNQ